MNQDEADTCAWWSTLTVKMSYDGKVNKMIMKDISGTEIESFLDHQIIDIGI
jgi:hypothetical protein